jgi:hypothetical protein
VTLWYISFATDKRHLGSTVVEAANAKGAIEEATRRKLNPGGEAMIVEVPKEALGHQDIARMMNRLAGSEEMRAHGGRKISEMGPRATRVVETETYRVCAGCNGGAGPHTCGGSDGH